MTLLEELTKAFDWTENVEFLRRGDCYYLYDKWTPKIYLLENIENLSFPDIILRISELNNGCALFEIYGNTILSKYFPQGRYYIKVEKNFQRHRYCLVDGWLPSIYSYSDYERMVSTFDNIEDLEEYIKAHLFTLCRF